MGAVILRFVLYGSTRCAARESETKGQSQGASSRARLAGGASDPGG